MTVVALATTKRSLAFFIDGASRATLYPFAPLLIGVLTNQYGDDEDDEAPALSSASASASSASLSSYSSLSWAAMTTTPPLHMWSKVSFYTAIMVVAYLLGRAIGLAFISKQCKIIQYYFSTCTSNGNGNGNGNNHHNSKAFSTTVGCIVALHIFSYGVGFNHHISVLWMIRFLMGFFNGLILQIISKDTASNKNKKLSNRNRHNHNQGNLLTKPTNKIWLVGFALSVLSSGLFYVPFHQSTLYTFLVRDKTYSNTSLSSLISFLFFVVIIYATQLVFDCFLKFLPDDDDDDDNDNYEGFGNENEDEDEEGYGDIIESQQNYALNQNQQEYEMTTSNTILKRRKNTASATETTTTSLNGDINAFSPHFVMNQSHQPTYNRARLGSYQSNVSDVFFDCESHFGDSFDHDIEAGNFNINTVTNGNDKVNENNDDNEFTLPNSAVTTTTDSTSSNDEVQPRQQQQQPRQQQIGWKDNSNSITKYENLKCVFEDGSPSNVPAGCTPSQISNAFQSYYKTEAAQKWEEMKKWRRAQKIYKIHAKPHTLFPRIKEAYPHCVHGYSKLGYPVVYEQPAKMMLKDMFQEGHSVNDMVYHYTYFLEYLSNVLCRQHPEMKQRLEGRSQEEKDTSDWGFVVVMDVSGISLSVFSGAVLQYLQKAGKVNSNYYPNTTTLALLVNSPIWLSGVFGKIRPLIPKSAKADLIGTSNLKEGLTKYIDEDQIPKEYGGSSPYVLDQHPFEQQLRSLVQEGLEREEEDDDDYDDNEDENDKNYENEKAGYAQEQDVGKVVTFGENTTSTDSIKWTYSPVRNNDPHDLEAGNNSQPRTPFFTPETHYLSQHSVTFVDDTFEATNLIEPNSAHYSEIECTFFNVSIMYWLSCAIQGALEVAFPIWFLVPKELGGLGYQPCWSGISLFTSVVLILWVTSLNRLKRVSQIPLKQPVRGYRIGIGSKTVLLVLLPFIARISRNEDMLLFTITILFGASIFIAMMIGRSSSATLHSIVSSAYHDKLSLSCDSRTRLGMIINILANLVRDGGLTWMLGTSGEVFGALMVSPFMIWSLHGAHSYPLNAALSFHIGAALCSALYIFSFSLKINGETVQIHNSRGTKCSIFANIISVSASDMAMILEAANISSCARWKSKNKKQERKL